MHPSSIRFRANMTFAMILSAIVLLGLVGVYWVSAFNSETSEVRDRWLRGTRYLGDIANYTSDYRAAEGENLLRRREGLSILDNKEIDDLRQRIAQAMADYQQVRHSDRERVEYEQFLKSWTTYEQMSRPAFESEARDEDRGSTEAFLTSSKVAYTRASDELEALTDHNNAEARQASVRATETIRFARLFGALTIALTVLLVLGTLLFVTRSMTNPLVELAACMKRLSDGDLNIEVGSTARRDELGRMARAVEVFRDNAVVLRDARQTLARQATRLKDELAREQELHQRHRTFISMISHEFRTPMTVVDGHAQRLINAAEPSVAVVSRARKIRLAVKRMTIMIENLLETSRLLDVDASTIFQPTAFDLRALVREVCALHEETSQQVIICCNIEGESQPFVGDRRLLFLAFGNLISNAIKYSVEEKRLDLMLRMDDAGAVIRFQDYGIGVPSADLHRIFDRFYRGANARSIPGHGLGLHIVKMIVDLHRGSIDLDGELGRGSSFTIRLPLMKGARAETVEFEGPVIDREVATG